MQRFHTPRIVGSNPTVSTMMYKTLNKIFGWDYIHWRNCSDQGISRVFLDGMDRPVYFRYKCTKVLDRIHKPEDVTWLTCGPDKYFKYKVPEKCS